MSVPAVPPGFRGVCPYLVVPDAAGLIGFLVRAFGAHEAQRLCDPEGRIIKARLLLEGSLVLVAEARSEFPARSAVLYVYVADVDASFRRAIAAGAGELSLPVDQFDGDRMAGVIDPAGNQWWLATRFAEPEGG